MDAKKIIEWCIEHPAEVTAAAGVVYAVSDTILRRVVSDATVAKWETEGGKIVSVLAKVYRILEPFFSKSR